MVDQSTVPEAMSFRRRLGWSGLGVLLALVLNGLLIPGFRHVRERAHCRSCFANQKTIMLYIDELSAKRGRAVSSLDDAVRTEILRRTPLPYWPDDPGEGENTYDNYVLVDGAHEWFDEGPVLFCKRHGFIQSPCHGSARAQLVALGIEDRLLLETCSDQPPDREDDPSLHTVITRPWNAIPLVFLWCWVLVCMLAGHPARPPARTSPMKASSSRRRSLPT